MNSRRVSGTSTSTLAAYAGSLARVCAGVALGLLLLTPESSADSPPSLSPDVTSIVGMEVNAGQTRLEKLGYEIVYAKSKTQYWWSDTDSACVQVSIKDKRIDKVDAIDDGQCTSRVEAARKIWDAYADGPADVHGAKLDAERARLSAAGYEATYWVKNISADKANSIEYWLNAKTGKCAFIAFRTSDGEIINKDDCEADRCKNPATKRKSGS